MRKITFCILVMVLVFTRVHAMERFDIVTTQDLKQMLEERKAGKIDFILINSLDEVIFKNSSIPGSVNLPWSKADKMIYRLGTDKNKLMIVY